MKVVPLPLAVLTFIFPPCASMMRLHMAKPKPMPCAFVVNNGEKSFDITSSLMPAPVSAKEISTTSFTCLLANG